VGVSKLSGNFNSEVNYFFKTKYVDPGTCKITLTVNIYSKFQQKSDIFPVILLKMQSMLLYIPTG